jgi:protein disulfide-isomerase A6
MKGLGQVAAINCDEDENKAFCGSLNIKGFPTLKTVRPTLIKGKPIIQDYNGPRTSKALVEALKNLIPNHVTKLSEKDLDPWLKENNGTTKAIIFSEKGTVSAMVKVMSTDFFGNVHFGQAKSKDAALVERFGITKFPSLVVLPGGEADPLIFDGEMSQNGMTEFIKGYASLATWDMKPTKKSTPKSKPTANSKASSSTSSIFSSAASSHASSEASETTTSATSLAVSEPGASASAIPVANEDNPATVKLPVAPSVPSLLTSSELQKHCLDTRSSTCILALLPAVNVDAVLPEDAATALSSLAQIKEKHETHGTKLFPIYSIPATNEAAKGLRSVLALKADNVVLIAINGKRSWWRNFSTEKGFGIRQIEDWIDAIRLGDGKKEKLPTQAITAHTPEETPVMKHEEL